VTTSRGSLSPVGPARPPGNRRTTEGDAVTELQGWFLVVELGVLALACAIWILARLH